MAVKPSAQDIKTQYELEWMRLDGVSGVGITEQNGKEAIVVYTSGNKKEVEKHIPKEINGYPIICEEAGEFTAF